MAKRKAVGFLIAELGLTERRGCAEVGLSRSVWQYRPLPKEDAAVVDRLKVLASQNRRYGFLRLHALLRREGLVINHKRTYRLYRQEGLQVRTKKRRKLPRRDRVVIEAPSRPLQRWSLDFMSDQLADYRRFRILNIVDDYSKFCPGQIVDLSLAGARLARSKDGLSLALGSDQLAPLHGLPEEIIPGNGPDPKNPLLGTSRALFEWSDPKNPLLIRRILS